MDIVELEFGLHRREAENYTVELRVALPDSEADISPAAARFPLKRIDFDALRLQKFDSDAYGRLLTDFLFSDEKMRQAFETARAVADAKEMALRLRLLIGSSAPELHGLYWESLRHPVDRTPLFAGGRILFSRYLTSADWRPVRRRPKAELRALVAIANPTDLAAYQPGGRPLAPIDVPGELARARAGLQAIRCDELAGGAARATLDRLVSRLREGCDILYLVCHGAVFAGEPYIWLEDEEGKNHRLSGKELVERIRELPSLPAMVVLASCQSATVDGEARSTEGGVLSALGPGLAEAGIPAVLAMQADVAMDTMADFLPALFAQLKQHGQIDRAVAVARGVVRERPDWFVPVLFMRLRGGSLWFTKGFEDKKKEDGRLSNWEAVLSQIETRRLTPILGPGLTDSFLGSRRDIAQRWAETFRFPMAPHDRDDLPQVAQFIATRQRASTYVQNELIRYLRSELLARYGRDLPNDVLRPAADEMPAVHLSRLISAIGKQRRKVDTADPFAVLARLPLPIYVTASQSDLITDALREANKEPQIDFCRWNDDLLDPEVAQPKLLPDPKRPLVYHLFGRLMEPESLVLTEDDYFDFLIGMKKNKEFIPHVVRRALADSGLLFLGFHLDDWNFRIMFRAIMDQEGGRGLRDKYAHIAAQIDPEEGRIIELDGARDHLERYFTKAATSIYWGSPDDFTSDLADRRQPAAVA